MNSARKKAAEAMAKIDVVIEVVDARLPAASSNPMIAALRAHRQRPCLKLLNKSDLADPAVTAEWLAHFNRQPGVKAVAISCKKPAEVARVPKLCQQLAPHRNDGTKPLRMMIMGIPNVGKSTLINTLAGRPIARTGNEPAVTKSQQRINLGDGIILLDTPGILWPKVENPKSSYRLAATGAIKDTAMEYADVAYFVADYLLSAYPQLLKERFDLETLPATEVELMDKIAARRGCLRTGGIANTHKVSEILINELRTATLGRITLEAPEMVAIEAIEVAEAIARKAEKKAQRLRDRKKGTRDSDRQVREKFASKGLDPLTGQAPPAAEKKVTEKKKPATQTQPAAAKKTGGAKASGPKKSTTTAKATGDRRLGPRIVGVGGRPGGRSGPKKPRSR